MTMGKASAMVAGFIVAFGVGVWSGPHLTQSRLADSKTLDEIATPFSGTRTATEAAAPVAPVEKTAKAAPPALPKVDVNAPALHRELKPLMNRGADMTINFALPPTGLYALAIAISMYAAGKAWNYAEHCQSKRMASALAILFWMFAAVILYDGYRYF